MLPLKPPTLKSNNYKGRNQQSNFTLVDDDENTAPMYHGIFNGKVILIKNPNEQTNLVHLGSYGQYGVCDKNMFVDYKTLQNQALQQKKNWQAMKLMPFKFPNIKDPNKNKFEQKPFMIVAKTVHSVLGKSVSTAIAESKEQNVIAPIPSLTNTANFCSQGPVSNSIIESEPSNWSELKTKFPKEFGKLVIKSGSKIDTQYYLFLEEAFFLSYTLECLEIKEENGFLLSNSECWKIFNGLKENFPFFYAAYHYYRAKGWVVRSGLQYGGDYVLYKMTPVLYHSSYVVVISINGQNAELLTSWPSWFGCDRTIEAAGKELLICTVHGPEYEQGMPIDLTQYSVNDTIVRRWVPSQHREKPQKHNYE